jgi:Protein of unknown function (DUF732)
VKRFTVSALLAAAVVAGCSQSADDRFISAVGLDGPRDNLIAAGHDFCQRYRSDGMLASLEIEKPYHLSAEHAAMVATAAKKVYCPDAP